MLNLLRSDELCVEDMMKRSFAEYHLLKNAPERERMIAQYKDELEKVESLTCTRCLTDVEDYYANCKELTTLSRTVRVRCCILS